MEASENIPAVDSQPEAFHAPDAVGTPAPAKPFVEQRIEQLVEEWFAAHFHNLGSGFPELLFNRVRSAAEELKTRLHALGL